MPVAHPKLLRALGVVSLASGALLLTGALPASAIPGISATSTGTILTALTSFSPGPTTFPSGAAASDTTFYTSDPTFNQVDVYSYASGPATPLALPTGSTYPTDLALSSDYRYLYVVASSTNQVVKYDLTAPGTPTVFAVASGPYGIILSPDDSVFYLASNSNYQIYAYDAVTGTELHHSTSNGYQEPGQLGVSADGAKVFATYLGSGSPLIDAGLRILNSDLTDSAHNDMAVSAEGLAVEANGDLAVGTTTGSVGTVAEYTPAGVATGKSTTSGHDPYRLILSRDGNGVYVADRQLGQLFAVDTASHAAAIGPFGSVGDPTQMALTPDGLTLFVAGGGGGIGHEVFPFSIAQVTLTGPAGIAPGAGPVTFHVQIADGQTPVGDYSAETVTFDVLNASKAVVATSTVSPDTSGSASAAIDLSALPSGTYSVRATLDPPAGAAVIATATGFQISSAALAATGVTTSVPAVAGSLLLFGGAVLLVLRRRVARQNGLNTTA